jgi:segregation and condensation protein A
MKTGSSQGFTETRKIKVMPRATKDLPFEDAGRRDGDDPTLIIDVDGFEGPLDLLLELARRQKVDLARISILALAEQYLSFIEKARLLRLELAADYLVMAAWLAYLKSRLLLPEPPPGEEPSAADLATALAFRLKRLEAVRHVAKLLFDRDILGRDVFCRGAPEPVIVLDKPQWNASLYDLLAAYGRQRSKNAMSHVTIARRHVWSLSEARAALEKLIGDTFVDWMDLDRFIRRYMASPEDGATVRASSFSAMLELVREGRADIRQDKPFAPLWLKRRDTSTSEPPS